jgi:bacteriocin-like protein
MRNVLSNEEMSQVSGGNFWGGFCVAVGLGNFAAAFLAITVVGGVLLAVADIGCLGYAASKL